MTNLEISGINLKCYLYVFLNNKKYCIDEKNNNLNIEIENGKYVITIIATKIKNYNLNDSLKSMSFKVKPMLLQPYKDRGFLNHILGWKNNSYFFIITSSFFILFTNSNLYN